MDMGTLINSLTEEELKFIAERDYGVEADIHLSELRKLIRDQDGMLSEGQYWHPYEVIELVAHSLIPGHEREFVACTLLVLGAVGSGYDTATRLDWKFSDRAADYDLLPVEFRELVLEAFARTDQSLQHVG